MSFAIQIAADDAKRAALLARPLPARIAWLVASGLLTEEASPFADAGFDRFFGVSHGPTLSIAASDERTYAAVRAEGDAHAVLTSIKADGGYDALRNVWAVAQRVAA